MRREQDLVPSGDWHASPALLTAYAGSRAGPVDAASLEIHLVACPLCRAELALNLDASDRALLGEVLARVVAHPPAASPRAASGRLSGSPWARLVLRPDALVAVTVAVALAFALDLLSRLGSDTPLFATGGGLLRVLAPAIPLAGIALCSTRAGDPCREAVLASPSAGLRLTLWRTLVVLAVALPTTVVLDLVLSSRPEPATWLLPGLALAATTLALGTLIDLPRAAVVIGVGWCVAVIGPTLAGSREGVRALADLAVGTSSSALLSGGPVQFGWLLLTIVAGAVLALRRTHYAWLDVAVRGSGRVGAA